MNNLWSKKIPTLIGLILITIGTVITTFLVRGDTIFQIRANPSEDPKNIKITNVSEEAFTITYITDDKVVGSVNYGVDPKNLDGISLDDRDQLSQKINKYNSHSITVRNLDPNTKYYFSITSGSKKYLDTDVEFEATTKGEVSSSPSTQIPISGKVILPDGTSPSDGLVYLKINDAQLTSTLLKEGGTYTIPLNTLRKADEDEYLEINDNTIINIDIFSSGLFSSVSVTPNEISPVPLVTISGSYNFSDSVDKRNEAVAQSEGFPSFGNISKIKDDPKILTPSSNETLNESQPTFEGTAEPNETVEIEIHSNENIKTQVVADENGSWEYTPSENLSPGNHTITIITKNKDGILKTITRNFIVYADGGISPTITQQPSATSPTSTPTQTPTHTPTPSIITAISPAPTLPPTGNSSVIIASIIGFTAAISGIIIFFLSRGKSYI